MRFDEVKNGYDLPFVATAVSRVATPGRWRLALDNSSGYPQMKTSLVHKYRV